VTHSSELVLTEKFMLRGLHCPCEKFVSFAIDSKMILIRPLSCHIEKVSLNILFGALIFRLFA